MAESNERPKRKTMQELKKLKPLIGYTIHGLTWEPDGCGEECQPVGILLKNRQGHDKTFWLPVALEGMMIQ